MAEARPLTASHSDVVSEVLLGDSLRVELEPDHVQKISQCLATPAGQNGPEDPGEADSDSGDSLFLTQTCVPEPVRTRRKRASDFMSDFRSRGNPELYEDQTSSSASDEGPKLVKKKWKRKTYKLPKYRFSFLSKTSKQGSTMSSMENTKLHNYAMGGFLNCVKEMWKSYGTLESQMSFLPTVDLDGECISPISEEEEGKEESLEDRDFKVVRKKQLVVSLKPRRPQPWYSPKESEVRRQKSTSGNDGFVSEERQQSRICKVPASAPLKRITLLSDTDSSDDGDGRVPTENPNTQICLELGRENTVFHQKENAEQLSNNSEAPVCEPSPEKRAGNIAEAAVDEPDAGLEPGSQNLPNGDAENGNLCSEERVKQRKKKKKKEKDKGNYESVLGGNGQSGEEAEREDAAADVMEAAAEQASRLSQVDNEPSILDSKRKKKKKKHRADDVSPELEGQCNEGVGGRSVVGLNVENGGKKKKKDVNDRVGQSDRGEMQKERKKKKARNETSDVPQTTTERSEENAQETSESSPVKRKKLKKKKKLSASNYGIQSEEDARVEVERSSDVITGTDFLEHVSGAPEEDEDVGHTQKITEILEEPDCDLVTKKRKKKKKKMREKSEDSIAQSDYLASEWKKERERTPSFLVADGEEEAETHGGNQTPHDRGAEKPDISTGRLASESPDITESPSRSKYGLKKKRRGSSLSPKKKGKRGRSTETSAHISSPRERETRDPDRSSSQGSQKKHKKAKRRLYNSSEDFLTS